MLTGAGRDLATDGSGRAVVVAAGRTEVVVDYLGDRRIRSIDAAPDVPGLDRLVGARAGSGFRRQLADALPDLAVTGSIVHLLLDETTPATLISGSSLARASAQRLPDECALLLDCFGDSAPALSCCLLACDWRNSRRRFAPETDL